MALVNDTLLAGNTFGYPHKGNSRILTITTMPIAPTATAAVLATRFAWGGLGATGGFKVLNLGIKAVGVDLVMGADETTPLVVTAYLETAAGTQTDKGNVTLTADMTIEHEDPPCYDDSFAAFYVAPGQMLILEHTTAATGTSTGAYSIVCQIELDPAGVHATD